GPTRCRCRPKIGSTPFYFFLAEREGFEPPEPFGSTVFKTAAFDRSATSPRLGILANGRCAAQARAPPRLIAVRDEESRLDSRSYRGQRIVGAALAAKMGGRQPCVSAAKARPYAQPGRIM